MIGNLSECIESIGVAAAYITMMRKTTGLQIGVGLALVELQDVEKVPLLQEGGLQGGRLELGDVVGEGDDVVREMSSVRQKKSFDRILGLADDD